MKSFFFTTEYKSARYGSNVTLKVYRVKNNTPYLVGEKHYTTGSYKGHDHEAVELLVEQKELPKKCTIRGGYINYDELDKSFKLIEL